MTTEKSVSLQTLQRLPLYLEYLKSHADAQNISARALADALSLGEIQVRKDLASVCDSGRPKTGFDRAALVADIEAFLGVEDVNDAILVGAGRLGQALMGYEGFRRYGLSIVAAFDSDARAQGEHNGRPVFPMEKLPGLVNRLGVRIGVITTPAANAQQVCDLMTANGILAIWNFAPTRLKAPDGVLIQNENMAASLALLRRHLQDALQEADRRTEQ